MWKTDIVYRLELLIITHTCTLCHRGASSTHL